MGFVFFGVVFNIGEYPLENRFNCQTTFTNIARQGQCIMAVETISIKSHITWSGGISDQRTTCCLHRRKATRGGAEGTGKGVVAAGIQNNDVETGIGTAHGVEEVINVNALKLHFFLVFDIGGDGDHEIDAAHLDTVTGIIKQTDAVFIIAQGTSEIEHGTPHLLLIGIGDGGDFEADASKCFGYQFGIVFWVFQRRAARIGRVSNDQRKTPGSIGFRAEQRGGKHQRQGKQKEKPVYRLRHEHPF